MQLIILPVVVSRELTEPCIETLLAQDIGNIHLIVVDNGSTDGVGQYLRTLPLKNITLITYAHRRGLNKVWNECMRIAFDDAKLDYVLICNNDTELLLETYRLLRDDPREFITGVSVNERDQFALSPNLTYAAHPDFSCFLIRKKVWETIGGFDEKINAYCGDLDYHLRMHAAGITSGSINIPFLHHRSGTIRLATNAVRDAIQQEADRDRAYFFSKHGVEACSPEYEAKFLLVGDSKQPAAMLTGADQESQDPSRVADAPNLLHLGI